MTPRCACERSGLPACPCVCERRPRRQALAQLALILPVFILVVFFGVVGHTFLNTSITSSISAGNLVAPDTAGHRAITHAPDADRGGEWLTRQPAGARDGRGVSADSPGMCGMDQFTYLMAFHAFARPPIALIAKALQRAGPPAYGARPAPGLALLSVPPPRVS